MKGILKILGRLLPSQLRRFCRAAATPCGADTSRATESSPRNWPQWALPVPGSPREPHWVTSTGESLRNTFARAAFTSRNCASASGPSLRVCRQWPRELPSRLAWPVSGLKSAAWPLCISSASLA